MEVCNLPPVCPSRLHTFIVNYGHPSGCFCLVSPHFYIPVLDSLLGVKKAALLKSLGVFGGDEEEEADRGVADRRGGGGREPGGSHTPHTSTATPSIDDEYSAFQVSCCCSVLRSPHGLIISLIL